jgi:glucose-6-phosphate isomerase/transaldolase/glucose-6-phosphate isomerase
MSNHARLDQQMETAVHNLLAEWQRDQLMARVWSLDHTVWKPDPTELANRLGWLTIAGEMMDYVFDLLAFAAEIRDEGYQDVVLLGMGGSSLATEVLRTTFAGEERPLPHASRFTLHAPRLHVLDSTVPGWVRRVTEAISDPARTLFIVSSKSGGTIEVMSFFKHFYALTRQVQGETAGENFIAITDPNTSLQKLAEEHNFRRVFQANPKIGGRYSALSHFGMVPAALMGLDVATLLDRAERMAQRCAANVPAADNPGAWLGVVLGLLAKNGRDKLTFITSPGLESFGLWAEQLIAESTGKENTGIVPIALEPMAEEPAYGRNRVFAYLRLEGGDNEATDRHAYALVAARQPLLRFTLADRYDLAAEFFRWELATAMAGVVLAIQPFDQPNVQLAKDKTKAVLTQLQQTGNLPNIGSTGTLNDLLAQAQPGDFLAIMAYLDGHPEIDNALQELRQAILERRHLANTMGYGPRFLHSTGQLHKGGANNGLFLQLTADYTSDDLPIPGEPYTFAGLVSSQAAGDYQALEDSGRRVVRLNLGADAAGAIRKLTQEV